MPRQAALEALEALEQPLLLRMGVAEAEADH